MQLHIILLVSAAAAAVASPLLPNPDEVLPYPDDVLPFPGDNLLYPNDVLPLPGDDFPPDVGDKWISKRGDDMWTCDDKRQYDPHCLCDQTNPLNWIWCAMMPSCESCGIPCDSNLCP